MMIRVVSSAYVYTFEFGCHFDVVDVEEEEGC